MPIECLCPPETEINPASHSFHFLFAGLLEVSIGSSRWSLWSLNAHLWETLLALYTLEFALGRVVTYLSPTNPKDLVGFLEG